MEKKKVDVLEQMQNMTIDLNSKALIEKAEKDGVETMYKRKLGYKVQCGFGLQGVCCRNCGMGPCRISPKTPRGLCGADEHTIEVETMLECVLVVQLPIQTMLEI